MELSIAPTVHAAIGSVTVFTISLKNIVHALRRMFAIAIALMFATVLSASAGDPPTLGTTELHTAAGSSGVAEVEVLLKDDAYVNAKDADGLTPLHSAALNNPSPAVLEVLLKAGADVNSKDAEGDAPLHFAARYNSTPAVLEVLIKTGADPRAINNEGKTPLDVAKTEYRDILWKAMMDKPLK